MSGVRSENDQPLLRPLRLLALGQQEPDWQFLQARLAKQQWELTDVAWSQDLFQVLQKLHTDHWDCLVISLTSDDERFDLTELSSFLTSIRECKLSVAILFLSSCLDVDLTEVLLENQCDFHEVASGWFSSSVGVMISRTLQLQSTAQRYQRLLSKEQLRSLREREEANLILSQQKRLLQGILDEKEEPDCFSTEQSGLNQDNQQVNVDPRYEQALRSFVILGSGRLVSELSELAAQLQAEGYSPRDFLTMHLACLDKLVEGLGERSSRHVILRADHMLLELMVHLAERYRCEAA